MAKPTGYTLQQKLDIVAHWERSGLPQDAYLDDHPVQVSSRTLRTWIALLRRPEQALEHRRALVEDALRDWRAISEMMADQGAIAVDEEIPVVGSDLEDRSALGPQPLSPPVRLALPPLWQVY